MPKLLAVDMEQERSAASSVALNGGIFNLNEKLNSSCVLSQ